MEGLISAIPGLILGLLSLAGATLAYRRGMKADDRAAEVASNTQVYAGYGTLLANVQNDNIDLRRRLTETQLQLDELRKKNLNG